MNVDGLALKRLHKKLDICSCGPERLALDFVVSHPRERIRRHTVFEVQIWGHHVMSQERAAMVVFHPRHKTFINQRIHGHVRLKEIFREKVRARLRARVSTLEIKQVNRFENTAKRLGKSLRCVSVAHQRENVWWHLCSSCTVIVPSGGTKRDVRTQLHNHVGLDLFSDHIGCTQHVDGFAHVKPPVLLVDIRNKVRCYSRKEWNFCDFASNGRQDFLELFFDLRGPSRVESNASRDELSFGLPIRLECLLKLINCLARTTNNGLTR